MHGCRERSECRMKARQEWKFKRFWPPWHGWDLKAWCSCDRSFHSYPSSHNSRGTNRRVKRSCFGKQFLFWRDMQRLARDGYTYYPTKDPMDSRGLSGMCSKNATSMPLLLCSRSSQDLYRWTPRCMAIRSSTIFIRHMQIRWVGFTMDQSHSFWAWSEWLMTTTTTNTCLVHQTEAQSNHCAVAKSEMCPSWSDL